MNSQSVWIQLGRPAALAGWKTEARVRAIAGVLVLISVGLSLTNLAWLWLAVFVGANLVQSGVTGWCLMSNLLSMSRGKEPAHDA